MTQDQLQQLAQAASEAAHAPAVKASAAVSTVVLGADWLSSGPGIIAVLGIMFTAATFLVNVWAAYRRDKREQMVAQAKMKAIAEAGTDTDPLPLDALPKASRQGGRA